MAIRSAVLKKMTSEFAFFGNFPDISEMKLSLPPCVTGEPDVMFSVFTSCRVNITVLFVNEKLDSRQNNLSHFG